ncbi:MAG TPA: DUF2279 domain-containing protein [Kofleriaceae bacterium]|nr:DUF2279 domain-containing protein [Kofleriaceae bacterium]
MRATAIALALSIAAAGPARADQAAARGPGAGASAAGAAAGSSTAGAAAGGTAGASAAGATAGTSAAGTSAAGTSAAGATAGTSAAGTSAAGTSAAGTSAAGTSAAGTSAAGAGDATTLRRDEETEGWTRGKLISAGALAGFYTALTVWAYFAWYHDKPQNLEFEVNGDGAFGVDTYAGGSDKLGHFWSNQVISRGTTEMLIAGGWKPLPASLIASGLSAAYFAFIEVKDGYYYEFSTGDIIGNLGGAALSALLINRPDIDRFVDFRVEYIPTREYLDGLEHGDINFVEDYSGQTYHLALHLEAIPALREGRYTRWTRYVDLLAGYQSLNYKPEPADPDAIESQHLFLGASLNLQTLLADLYGEPPERGRARTSHRIGHFALEFVSVPYTTLRLAEAERSRSGM